MKAPISKPWLVAGTVMVAVAAAALAPTMAHAASDGGPDASPATTVTTVATQLNVPRGIVYDPAGRRVLVAESGVAAADTGPCTTGGQSGLCFGATGSVFSYSLASGSSSRIVTGLPAFSNAAGQFVQGLEDLSLYRGQLTGVFSLSGTTAARAQLGPGAADLGQAVVFGPHGSLRPVADVAAKEAHLYGPDATSNPFGVTTGPFGMLIANAYGTPAAGTLYGGNDILQLRGRSLSQLVAFPQRTLAADPSEVVNSAPDVVIPGPGGAFYVGELTAYPYYPSAADIWRVVPGHAPTLVASGLTKVIDMAFDSQGRLLILESGKRDMAPALLRLNRDGTLTNIPVAGLNVPGGLAITGRDTLYITNNSGGVGGDGQLLKVTVSGGV
ncbi:MAG TPA: ScyD/ScyE family protein [Trebonia sp.]|nr:ScyD/ScyE family protein [Trebonia sp.]